MSDKMKRLGLYTSSLLSFILLVNQCIQAWSGDDRRFTLIILGLSYAFSVGSISIIAFKKEIRIFAESDPTTVFSYPRFYKLARLALAALLIVPPSGSLLLYESRKRDCDQIRILVANFYGENPEKYQVTEEIITKLKNSLATYGDTNVISLGKVITEQQGSVEARRQGEKECAKIVVWGRYATANNDIRLTVHVENLDGGHVAIGTSVTYVSLARIDAFQFQIAYPAEINSLALFVVGSSRFFAGKYDEARDAFSSALCDNAWPKELDLLRARLLFYRGNTYSILKDYPSAMKDFTVCIELDPTFAMAYNNRGIVSTNLSDRVKDCEKAKELDPSIIYPYINLGAFYLQSKDLSRSIENLSKAVEIDPSSVLARFDRGSASIVQRNYAVAIDDLSVVIKHAQTPNIAGLPSEEILALAYGLRGSAYSESGKAKEALTDLQVSTKINPRCTDCYNYAGLAYGRTGDYQRAQASFLKALEVDPKFGLAHFNLGQLYLDKGQVEAAFTENLLTIESDPSFSEAYGKAGYLFYRKRDYVKSAEYAAKGISLDPNNPNCYFSLGLAHYGLKEYEESLKDFDRAIKLNPKFSHFYSNRARSLNQNKMYSEAIRDCDDAIALDSNNAQAFLMRGTAYGGLGDKHKAKIDLNKVFDLTNDQELVVGAVFALTFLGEKPDRHVVTYSDRQNP